MDPNRIADTIESIDAIDSVAVPVQRSIAKALRHGPTKNLLSGQWLGHPLHPSLTDLPIGFWTSAFMLDFIGGERSRPASELLVGLGVASVLPTAAAGFADWSELDPPERRSGAVHAAANLAATALYSASFVARRRGEHGRGVYLGVLGAAAATIGGFLGGHLTFRRAVGVNPRPLA